MKKAIFAASLLATSIMTTPAMAVPSPAADPSALTSADEQAVCDAVAAAQGGDPTMWRASVIDASSSNTTPTAIAGTENNINHRPDTSSTFTYANFLRTTDPLSRTGGSPNMWGQMVFGDKVWDNTLYDVQMLFNHDTTYTWTCHVEEHVSTIVHHPGNGGGNDGTCGNSNGNNNGGNLQTGGNGEGNNGCGNGNGGPTGNTSSNTGNGGNGGNGNNNGDNLQTGGNGNGNNGCGNGNSGPNGTNENCGGNGGGNEGWDETVWNWEFRSDVPESVTHTGIADGYDTTATGLQLLGHYGTVNYSNPGTYTPEGYRLLSCISPGKKGGSWTAKSWYTGGKCSTATFDAAPTMYPSHMFDSPPTNSLPTY